MNRLINFIVVFFLIFGIHSYLNAQENDPSHTWRRANIALKNNDLETALSLYQKVLRHSEIYSNLPGQANALEAIALVYQKKENYGAAIAYCKRSLKTGNETFRAYFLLAQIAYKKDADIKSALNYCDAGLSRFPNNPDLTVYRNSIAVKPAIQVYSDSSPVQDTSSEQREYHNSNVNGEAVSYLTALEKEVASEMNLARTNPRQYAKFLQALAKHYSGKLLKQPGKIAVRTQEGVTAVEEAIRYLNSVDAVPALRISRGLSYAAKDHVNDQSHSGETGHHGKDGSKPHERMDRYGEWKGVSGENIAYGDHDARMIVMQLIIDDGVPGRGHRDNIFNPRFGVTGVAISTHPVYRTMCVITYAGDYIERENLQQN